MRQLNLSKAKSPAEASRRFAAWLVRQGFHAIQDKLVTGGYVVASEDAPYSWATWIVLGCSMRTEEHGDRQAAPEAILESNNFGVTPPYQLPFRVCL